MKRAGQPIIDVIVASRAWTRAAPRAAALCRKVAAAAFDGGAAHGLRRRAARVEISVVLTSDRAIRGLNAMFRKKDKATNVLSFPAMEPATTGLRTGQNLVLGDVVIAYGTVVREAREAAKPLKNHLSHMVVHGVLHLLGYDHESASDARIMEKLETSILSQLGIADPYGEQGSRARVAGVRPRP